jgi:Na+/H+ antiporter NhaC
LEHVGTQMPYALFVAACSIVGFLLGGLFLNAALAWIGAIALFVAGMIFLPRIYRKA